MDLETLNIDPSVFNEFIDESTDMLETLDQLFVKLEEFPNDQNIISSIFRPVHSIKGNAAFFGLNKIKKLAHELETLLDKVRKNTLQVTTQLIDVILLGADNLKLCFENIRNNQPEISDEKAFKDLLDKIKSHAGNKTQSTETHWAHLFDKFDEIKEMIDVEDLNIIHQLQSFSAILENIHPNKTKEKLPLPTEAQTIMDIIDLHTDCKISTDEEDIIEKSLIKLKDDNPQCADDIEETIGMFSTFMTTTGFDPLLAEIIQTQIISLRDTEKFALTKQLDKNQTNTSEKNNQPKTTPENNNKTQTKQVTNEKNESDKTMRVSEGHIDTFLEYVGELLVVGDMFSHLEKSLSSGKDSKQVIPNFRRANDTFSQLSNSLQSSIMSIRKIPVKTLLQKVPRLVRDIATKLEKKIKVNIIGDNIQIDKSIIDMLDSPLTHMVRNSADHGIELPDKRIKAGKEPEGNVTVTVSESDTSIVMVIADDGGGLDGKAIHNKAISMGIIKEETKLTDQEEQDLIFASGLSTAKEVTDISGRGVGMDVVRRFIEDAGGTVSVSSILGKGSEFTITLPKTVTTQIMFGYLVSISGERYVLPMAKVHENSAYQ